MAERKDGIELLFFCSDGRFVEDDRDGLARQQGISARTQVRLSNYPFQFSDHTANPLSMLRLPTQGHGGHRDKNGTSPLPHTKQYLSTRRHTQPRGRHEQTKPSHESPPLCPEDTIVSSHEGGPKRADNRFEQGGPNHQDNVTDGSLHLFVDVHTEKAPGVKPRQQPSLSHRLSTRVCIVGASYIRASAHTCTKTHTRTSASINNHDISRYRALPTHPRSPPYTHIHLCYVYCFRVVCPSPEYF